MRVVSRWYEGGQARLRTAPNLRLTLIAMVALVALLPAWRMPAGARHVPKEARLLASGAPWAGGPTAGMDVLSLGTDGYLYMRGWDGHGWGGWASLAGVVSGWPGIASAPAVASWGPGRMDIFVRGSDGALWHMWWDGTQWNGWESLGGGIANGTGPAAVAWGPDRLDLLVDGTDGQLWHRVWAGSQWYGWEPMGGALTSAPAAASWGYGRLDVFVRGADGAAYQKVFDGGWFGWSDLGGALTADPAAASSGPGRVDLFARGTDSGLYRRWWDGARWQGWEARGGALTSGPAASSWAPGQLDVFVRGTDSATWHTRLGSSGWTGWGSLGGDLASALGATPWLAPTNVISNVPYEQQQRELTCEEAALQMALAHQGISATQDDILNAVGVDPRHAYHDARGGLHWGDPYTSFVGDPNGSEVNLTGYGTYDTTLARVAEGYGANVLRAGEGTPPQAVYDAVLGNHPVVAWVSFDWRYHPPGSWMAFDGRRVQYEGPVEHTVTVVGVNQTQVFVDNPWFGPQWVSRATFEAAYGTYHDMAVIMQ